MPLETSRILQKNVVKVEPLRQAKTSKKNLKIGFLPVMLGLYDSIMPELRTSLQTFTREFLDKLNCQNDITVLSSGLASKESQVYASCKKFADQKVDMIVVAHISYAPSGQIAPALKEIGSPILLWPIQPMSSLNPDEYDDDVMLMNHGVHGAFDLANILRRKNLNFGTIYGFWKDASCILNLKMWAVAGRALNAMKRSNPIIIGNHFEDMDDLNLDEESFLRGFTTKPIYVDLDQYSQLTSIINEEQIEDRAKEYSEIFQINKNLTSDIIKTSARYELSLKKLLKQYNSSAFGINFIDVCNHKKIADALHVPASILMSEGFGYGAEGDWVTAMLMHGLQSALDNDLVSFTEIFSVGYDDGRAVLRHWGEGNINMAKEKPQISLSSFNDKFEAQFAIVNFEYKPGPVQLVNLNVDNQSRGQIISIKGNIEAEKLPKSSGARAIFKPEKQLTEMLEKYTYAGGSHHFVMVRGDNTELLDRIARLAGWSYVAI